MIRGMSYPKGVFYMDKDHIAHATMSTDGEIQTTLLPYDSKGILFFVKRTVGTIPWYFAFGMILLACWIWLQPNEPFYLIALAAFGYHFMFPYPLKLYHGAEHKVFSHQGEKTIQSLSEIKKCTIVNRHCSTNAVVTFYCLFLLGWIPLGGNMAALLGILGVFLIPRWLKPVDQHIFFPISAFFQRKVTTIEPDLSYLKVALLSYITLKRKKAVTEELLLQELQLEEAKRKEKQLQEERERVLRETEWLEI